MLSRYVNQQVSVSRALAAALADNGLPNSQVIHNGLPLEEFPPRPEAVEAVRQRFGLATELIVAGGRMNFFKGQQQALEAFGRLAKERPRAQLVLAGRRDDWFGELLARRAVELGVAERVVFTDFLPRREFLALLGAGALFANLSMYLDPFPTVNLEAGASGLPVVGTCFGGTPEVVLDGHTGRLVNPYQVDQVTDALRSLLNNRAERTRLGRNSAERVRGSFPMCAMTGAYARLFDSLT
jgi:glycosyltransferase involved in cell wall biosynthesis